MEEEKGGESNRETVFFFFSFSLFFRAKKGRWWIELIINGYCLVVCNLVYGAKKGCLRVGVDRASGD